MVKNKNNSLEQASIKQYFHYAASSDITEYLESLRWIEQTLFQWASIVESADDAILGKDLNGIVTSWNRAAETMYGYKAKEMVGNSIATIFPPNQKDELSTILGKIKRNEQITHYETKRMRKDKKIIDVSVTISPIRDIAGNVVGASTIARDITEYKQINNERLNLAAIVDNADQAIISQSAEGTIISWNKAAQKLFGYSAKESVGKSLYFLFSPAQKNIIKKALDGVNSKQKNTEYEVEILNKKGKKIHTSLTFSPIKDDKGKFVGTSLVARDISLRLEQERNKELEIVAKDEFVSLASHQLRAPATAAKQYAGMLKEGYMGKLAPDQQLLINKACESIDRQLIIIDNLLKVARAEAGKVTLHKEKLNLVTLIKDIVQDQTENLKSRKQQVLFKPKSDDFTVVADKNNLRMVLENIIDNASKYTQPGKTIAVSISQSKGMANISVRDQGVGINKKVVDRVFDKFARIDNPLSSETNGTGLGLYWANKIIKMHNGRIEVESKPNKGSTFTVLLPA